MTEMNQIYRCAICGNIVQVLHTGTGTLVCCNQPMEALVEQTADLVVDSMDYDAIIDYCKMQLEDYYNTMSIEQLRKEIKKLS